MGAIVTGTVVYWEVIGKNTVNERVNHKDDKVVSVYLTDDGRDEEQSAVHNEQKNFSRSLCSDRQKVLG
jgi:hypothetical protein